VSLVVLNGLQRLKFSALSLASVALILLFLSRKSIDRNPETPVSESSSFVDISVLRGAKPMNVRHNYHRFLSASGK
jgi:hypothetical protein